jgi:hypothetical protein
VTYKQQVGDPPLDIRSIYFVVRRIEEDPGDSRFERVIGVAVTSRWATEGWTRGD